MPADADRGRLAVVLVSGGLDSATVLALATSKGTRCYALTFDYGQRHREELNAAKRVAQARHVVDHRIVRLDIGWMGGSALTDREIPIPQRSTEGIPATYVPARNTVFLSIALAWAEVLGATEIYIGTNAVDYSGYPDCRPEFIQAFGTLANVATKAGVEGRCFQVHAPLMNMTKSEIIRLGTNLGVDYSLTMSCYDPDAHGFACGSCDACRLRAQGFVDARIADPTRYTSRVSADIQ